MLLIALEFICTSTGLRPLKSPASEVFAIQGAATSVSQNFMCLVSLVCLQEVRNDVALIGREET